MAKDASPPARKANRTGKFELVSSHLNPDQVVPNIFSQSSAQFIALSTILLTAPLLLQVVYSTYFVRYLPTFPALLHTTPPFPHSQDVPIDPSSPLLLDACRTHSYTTQIVSLDPLMLYINNFTSAAEAEALIKLGSEDFEDSFISRTGGGTQKVSGRTSQSAPLDLDHPLVSCSTSPLPSPLTHSS
ncbi:uncharacterized protein N0V89_011691 [Didymosphaeria variabile]|uniref:Uncharacterized protein n=1 Tax=Didymosphaeria variabile TaxID=1932322 RepID=A0A9W9C6M6_9PLEO|nr:uncharacterized protein N0V89_011691 [Didymosphaeria variabile]KAJ4345558.1 hypothetical protein N0V89_011691 [Didymosphaeria variabile]